MIFPWWYRLLGVDLIIGSKMNEIASLKNLLEYNQHLVDEKDQEIRRLTDLMLVEHGVIHPEGAPQEPREAPKSINRRPSWNQVKTRYEEADAKLAAEQSGTLRDYWLKKDQEAAMEGKVI